MSTVDRIEAAAKEATKGPWVVRESDEFAAKLCVMAPEPVKYDTYDNAPIGGVCCWADPDLPDESNAIHIANMDPQTTLKIAAVVRAAETWEKWRDGRVMAGADPYHHEEVMLAAALAALNQETIGATKEQP